MISVNKALFRSNEIISSAISIEVISTLNSNGRILAEEILADINIPSDDNSAMDGYAIKLNDALDCGLRLPVTDRITAGQPQRKLHKKTATRIFTGGLIPKPADTVVAQEFCDINDNILTLPRAPKLGSNIRLKGQDVKKGEVIARPHTVLNAGMIGLLVSQGISKVRVFKKPTVGLLATGDELCAEGESLQSGQIYNSNIPMLASLMNDLNIDSVDLGACKDDAILLKKIVSEAVKKVDVIITTGGASVGDEDHLEAVIDSLGEKIYSGVSIKPGKPVKLGKILDCPLFALPGNPVSVFVTFIILVKPLLLKLSGNASIETTFLKATAKFIRKKADREQYHRGYAENVDGRLSVNLFPNQSSGVLSSVAKSNVLIRQLAGDEISFGSDVDVMFY